jgi:hypothetical protein
MAADPKAELQKAIQAIMAMTNQSFAQVAEELKKRGGSLLEQAKKWQDELEKQTTAIVEKASAPIVVSTKPERNVVEYDSIQDFIDTVIIGMLVTVQAVQNNSWTVEIDLRLGPDGKLQRKPRSQPSIYGEKESTLPGAKPGDMYLPTQHLLPIRVTDPINGEVTDKWLDTNAGFRKAYKEHLANATMPARFTLKSTGVNDTYRCFINPAK